MTFILKTNPIRDSTDSEKNYFAMTYCASWNSWFASFARFLCLKCWICLSDPGAYLVRSLRPSPDQRF